MRYLLVFFYLFISLAGLPQNAKIDSLKKVIETTKIDTVKGRTLSKLANLLSMAGQYKEALKAGSEGLALSRKAKDVEGIAVGLRYVGVVQEDQGDFSKALDYYRQSYKVYESQNGKVGMANNLIAMGQMYFYLGRHADALEYYFKGLKLAEKIKHQKGVADANNNIGGVYEMQGNFPKALEYYQKCLEINKMIGNRYGIAGVYNNIGMLYDHQGNFSKSLEYTLKGIEIFEQLGDRVRVATLTTNIGVNYHKKGNYPKALEFYQKGLQMKEQNNDRKGRSLALINMGDCYMDLKDYQKARQFILQGFHLAQETGHLEYMKGGAELITKIDSVLGDYKSAFEHHKLFKQYSDSLHNEDKAKEFGRVESKYQFEKEAEEAKRKQEAQAKSEGEKTQRRNNLQYLTIFAGIIGLFAGLIFIGKFRIPTRVMDIAVFAGLLILFEFFLILFDPLFEQYSGGIPFYKLGFNTLVAFGFAPLHGFLEDKLKKRLMKTK